MSLKKLTVSNFKSFDRLEVDLQQFNVLVGANAAGKSNFVNVLKFLRDISLFNLRDAISLQGGVKYLRNISLGHSQDLAVEAVFGEASKSNSFYIKKKHSEVGIRSTELTYGFALKFNKKGVGFQVADDHFKVKFEILISESRKHADQVPRSLGPGFALVRRVGNRPKYEIELPPDSPLEKDDIMPSFLRDLGVPPRGLMCERPFYFFFSPSGPLFRDIGIYDFDPKLSKKASQIAGRSELEEGGGNLALVLRSVIEHGRSKRKLRNLVRELLPFVEEAGVERLADKSLLFTMREQYFRKENLPASLVSDGSIGIAALIIALYFEQKSVVAIEEPERNIHPYLMAKVVQMMKDASEKKQIIITTHNPEIVKHAGIESLLLVSRTKSGFSGITRPKDNLELKEFLRNEIGIEELFAQNLLEV